MAGREYHESLWEQVPAGSRPEAFEPRRAFLLARVQPGERVLDVGCGEGWFTSALRGAGAHPVGIDVAEEPLRRGRAREPELDLRLVGGGDGEEWPFSDAEFDAVWAGEVIEHVVDTAGWLSQVRRVLRPGGALLASTPDHGWLTMLGLALFPRRRDRHFDPRSDHLRFYSRRSLTALLADFRFEEVGVSGLGGVPGARRTLLVGARRARF